MRTVILKGNIVHAPVFGELSCMERGYLVAEDGIIEGVYDVFPGKYSGHPALDFGDAIITQAFCDMHLHAPQYIMLGLGMDMQLRDWLNAYAYPTEAKFKDVEFARGVYEKLASELTFCGTTRVSMFSSTHTDATLLLMKTLEESGVCGFVGKINMDRNSPRYIREDTDTSLSETERWLEGCGDFKKIKPIISPRFASVCSDELMKGLGDMAARKGIPVQSHLSETVDETDRKEYQCFGLQEYWHKYEKPGLLNEGSLMGHCVYSSNDERQGMLKKGVWAVHCPYSNLDVASGIMPVRRFLNEGIPVALGSDIAGGAALFMPDVITAAIRGSKLNWINTDKKENFLTAAEGFYLGTSAGAVRFGDKPGFATGNKFHAIVVDDSRYNSEAGAGKSKSKLPLKERFERMLYRIEPVDIKAVYAEGERVK